MRVIYKKAIYDKLMQIKKTNDVIWVLKDNAYGFGIEQMMKIALQADIHFFAVKSIEEAILVRSNSADAEILILGKRKSNEISKLKEYRIIPTINDFDDYILFKKHQLPAHLAIDTGMNRFGMRTGYLAIINDSIVKSIYTHLYSDKNCEEKIAWIEELAQKYAKPLHIGGSMAYQRTNATLRIGKIIYEHTSAFYGHVVNVKELKKGDTVGYDGTYQALKEERIAICDIGYVDGLELYYHGMVSIRHKKYPCVGKCCMDHCFILIDDEVLIGDKVEFFGDELSEDDFIRDNHMTKYELYLAMNQQKTLYS